MKKSTSNQSNRQREGVLLVGHGTRDVRGTSQFFDLCSLLKDQLADSIVEPCLLEFQSPTIPEAWSRLVGQAVEHISIAPLLLFAAGHAKQDIPELVRQCQKRTPDVTSGQVRPISRHPAIIELACSHLRHSMNQMHASPDSVTLVTVGRGSYDPCAQADMRLLGAIIASRLSVSRHQNAFYAMAKPRLPDVLDQIARASTQHGEKDQSILVHPHLLFDGRLYQAIQKQVDAFRQTYPTISIQLSAYLGANEQVAKAMSDRVRQAQS